MSSLVGQLNQWSKPDGHLSIQTIDAHTGGEPLRVVVSGFPELAGETILAKRRHCQDVYDHLRRVLMYEPRGHADMYGAVVVEPERPDSHFGAIFMHNEGYSTMCGHAVIALTKLAVESGLVPQTGVHTQVWIDVPCGQIRAVAHADSSHPGQIGQVAFECVPSFVEAEHQSLEIDGFGTVNYDLAFGGAYYAYVQAADLGLTCDRRDLGELARLGRLIKSAVSARHEICHPESADLGFLYGTIFIDESTNAGVHSRNVCVFADGEVDRSPTGSGVSGRVALHVAKDELGLNESITIESVVESRFEVRAVARVDYFGREAVIPEVKGQAHITGKHEFIIDPNDVLGAGFLLR